MQHVTNSSLDFHFDLVDIATCNRYTAIIGCQVAQLVYSSNDLLFCKSFEGIILLHE